MTSDSIVVVRLPVPGDPTVLSALDRDAVALTAQERRRPRRRVTSAKGRALTLALPAGEVVAPGCVIHVGPGWYVVVEAAREAVLAITPGTAAEGIRVALAVGSLHGTLALEGERLLVPDDPAMERLLRRLDVPWVRAREPFVPLASGTPH